MAVDISGKTPVVITTKDTHTFQGHTTPLAYVDFAVVVEHTPEVSKSLELSVVELCGTNTRKRNMASPILSVGHEAYNAVLVAFVLVELVDKVFDEEKSERMRLVVGFPIASGIIVARERKLRAGWSRDARALGRDELEVGGIGIAAETTRAL